MRKRCRLNRRTYVQYHFLGTDSLLGPRGEDTFLVKGPRKFWRDPTRVERKPQADSFIFFDIVTTVVEVGGEMIKLESRRVLKSQRFFFEGEVFTKEALEMFGEKRLLAHMEVEGADRAIRLADETWALYRRDAVLLNTAATAPA